MSSSFPQSPVPSPQSPVPSPQSPVPVYVVCVERKAIDMRIF
ncbi:hypothetical protein [Sphaerospermopsis sp. FACHB-1094]|nr:hypothetical protein [Sphaerospermopsis sp. FACHB-1094]